MPHERKTRQPGIRQEMLAGLPEEIEEYVIPTDETCGICGGKMKAISKKLVRTEVEYRPAKIVVKHVVQQIAKCMECGKPGSPNEKSNFRKASVPVSPLAHSIATPSLVAGIMNAKYVNGMPLARQERELARYNLHLSTKTMANWIIGCAD